MGNLKLIVLAQDANHVKTCCMNHWPCGNSVLLAPLTVYMFTVHLMTGGELHQAVAFALQGPLL